MKLPGFLKLLKTTPEIPLPLLQNGQTPQQIIIG
jgi:hypothetical protein